MKMILSSNYMMVRFEAISRVIPVNHHGWHRLGDEEINDDEEQNVENINITSIPSTLRAVIKFGYEDSMKKALGNVHFNSWMASVFTHTQAHFRHEESLGTKIEFEVCNIVSYLNRYILGSINYPHAVQWKYFHILGSRKRDIPRRSIMEC